MEVVYSNLISSVKSIRTWNSCSVLVKKSSKVLCVVEVYRLDWLVDVCMFGVPPKLFGMSSSNFLGLKDWKKQTSCGMLMPCLLKSASDTC